MKSVKTLPKTLPVAALIGGLLAFTAPGLSASAQEATVVPPPTGPTQEVDTPPAPGTPQHAAQIQREHERAVAAGDTANDPLNSASSDALNQQEAAKAAALGNDPVPADTTANTAPDAIPPATDSLPPPIPDPLQPDTTRVQ